MVGHRKNVGEMGIRDCVAEGFFEFLNFVFPLVVSYTKHSCMHACVYVGVKSLNKTAKVSTQTGLRTPVSPIIVFLLIINSFNFHALACVLE